MEGKSGVKEWKGDVGWRREEGGIEGINIPILFGGCQGYTTSRSGGDVEDYVYGVLMLLRSVSSPAYDSDALPLAKATLPSDLVLCYYITLR